MWCDGCINEALPSETPLQILTGWTNLVGVVIVSIIEMLLQALHEADLSTSALDQLRNSVHNVKRVGPLVTCR